MRICCYHASDVRLGVIAGHVCIPTSLAVQPCTCASHDPSSFLICHKEKILPLSRAASYTAIALGTSTPPTLLPNLSSGSRGSALERLAPARGRGCRLIPLSIP